MTLDIAEFSPLGPVGRVTPLERGFAACVGSEVFRAEVVRADILRLAVSRAGIVRERPTFATDFDPPASVPFTLEESPAEVVLRTQELRLVLTRGELHFDVFRADGSAVLESARDAGGRSLAYQELNDRFALVRRARPEDLVLGLGEKTGPLDRRGRSYTLFNVDVLSPNVLELSGVARPGAPADPESTTFDPYYSSIPFFLHAVPGPGRLTTGGSFIDNGGLGRFDFEAVERIAFEFTSGAYTEYVLAGPTPAEVLEGYTFLTGRPRLPPLWALGHHQCRWHDYTDEAFVELGREYRARGIPCDALWLDIGHMDGYRVFSFHPERFPEPERTFESLRADGFRCVTIMDPGVKREPGDPLFDRGVLGNHFCKTEEGTLYEGRVWPGRTVFPDFVREPTRAFWAELVRDHALRGVDGIWNDMNEPATGAVAPFAMRFDRDGENHAHERFHNQYALLMALATREGLLAARPEERPFVLSRAGSAGIQRVAAQWLGDHSSSFAHLGMGLPMALGLGLSGQAFVGGDVPGFAGTATPELAARWFEYAALTPFCRCHHERDRPDHYPWSFGPQVERVAREALELRYRLLPYLYAAFFEASQTGAPVQRPLVFEFPEDAGSWRVEDEFLLGDALLVAPVLAAGETSRRVYLPPGSWLDWHTGERHTGEHTLEVSAAIGRIPLFARGGAVIPLLQAAPMTTRGLAPSSIELHVCVPAGDGVRSSVLYEDDGHTTAHLGGAMLLTRLELERRGSTLTLRGATRGDGFESCRRERFALQFRGETPLDCRLNGSALPVVDGGVSFPHTRHDFELVAKLPASVDGLRARPARSLLEEK